MISADDLGGRVTVFGYEVVTRSLQDAGVRTVFGLIGDGNMGLVSSLEAAGVAYLGTRHESGAVSAAAGYAFASDSVAVATVTYGPGFGNALTALRAAADLRLPVVLLVGDIEEPFHPQNHDHRAYADVAHALWLRVDDEAAMRTCVADAAELALDGRLPCVLDIPMRLMDGVVGERYDRAGGPAQPRRAGACGEPTGEAALAIEEATAVLRRAARPVIVAGAGAVCADSRELLVELARRSGALLATTMRARGLFAGEGLDIGMVGGFATATTKALLRSADAILAFGASLNVWTTGHGSLFADATVVCVDPAGGDRPQRVDVPVAADAREVARAMVAAFAAEPRRDSGRPPAELAEEAARARSPEPFEDQTGRHGIDPRTAMRELDRLLPADRRLIVGAGQCMHWPAVHLHVEGGRSFLPALGAGAIGHELGTAIGASIACPERPTVCLLGDGALLMSLGELEVAARSGANLLIVVFNDNRYATEVHKLGSKGLPGEVAAWPAVSFAGVMNGVGGRGVTVTAAEDLTAVSQWLGEPDGGPLLLDLQVNPEVVSERFLTGAGARGAPA